MTSREIAQGVIALSGQDARDRKFVTEHTKRVSKALRILKDENVVRSSVDGKGNVMWMLRAIPLKQEAPAVRPRLLSTSQGYIMRV